MLDLFVNVYVPSFFDWVIETSIMASIVVGLILCVKILLRNKLTPRWQYILWMILMIRLLLPWAPDSSYSIYSLLSDNNGTSVTVHQDPVSSSQERIQEKADIDNATKEDISTPSSAQQGQENKKQTYSNHQQNDDTFSLYTTALYIWLAGVIILSFATIVMNRRLRFYIKKQPVITDEKIVKIFENCKKSMSMQQDIPLLLAGKISSPTVFGFFKPRVLLSSTHIKVLNTQQLQHIFYHELAHIKRRDVGVNWLMHGLLILNWFNPILWYAYSRMREDQELACDALALTFIDSEEQIAYGHTIISLLEHYSSYYQVPSLANLSRNKKTLKRRILMIKKFQKKSYRWSVLGVVTVIAISTLSLLNAQAEEPKENIATVHTKDTESESIAMIIEKVVGTPEQAKKDFGISKETYEKMTEEFSVAKKYLTKEEFEQFVQLQQNALSIQKNTMVQEGDQQRYKHELLSEEDDRKLQEISNEIQPLWEKIMKHFPSTIEEAKKVADFPIENPTYIPEGYLVQQKEVYSDVTMGKPKPVIRTEYTEGDAGQVVIWQSNILEGKENPWNQQAFDTFEEYKLEGKQVTFGTYDDSNVTGMRMIVPAKDGKAAYQIVITVSILDKAEMEKIMLSMLK